MTDQTPIQLHSLADITEALVRVLRRRVEDIPKPPRLHPEQEEADHRRIERHERDRDFRRVYGDGR